VAVTELAGGAATVTPGSCGAEGKVWLMLPLAGGGTRTAGVVGGCGDADGGGDAGDGVEKLHH
jgi:hypothetical protein